MKHLPKYQIWMLGMSVGALIAILIAPQTGWTARKGIASLVVQGPNYDSEVCDSAEERVLSNHPGDHRLSIAGLVMAPRSPADPDRLVPIAEIEEKFPDAPAITAAVTRTLCRNQIVVDTATENEVLENFHGNPDNPITPAELRVIGVLEDAAVRGESSDPNNAYFTTMHAAAEFAKRDFVAADADLDRAGNDSSWNEYLPDEVYGRWRLGELAHGRLSGLEREESMSSVLLAQYARIHAAARMGTWRALVAETDGNVAEGIQLRHALIHIGALMRVKSTFYVGTLVGIAISNLAISRPGGASLITADKLVLSEEQRSAFESQGRRNAYRLFLLKHGYSDEANWASQELAAGDLSRTSKALLAKLNQQYVEESIAQLTYYVLNWLILGWMIVASIFWCGSKIGQAALSAKQRGSIGLHSSAKIFAGLVVAIVLSVVLRRSMIVGQIVYRILPISAPFAGWYGNAETAGVPHIFDTVAYCALALPYLLFAITTTLVSWIRRQPAGRTLRVATMKSFIPVVSALLLMYCVLVVFRSREDLTIRNDCVAKLSVGEGPYFAKLAGQPWPGTVPEPAQTT